MYRSRLLGPADDLALRFTSSMESDKLIACETLEVVKAYLKGLVKAGLLDASLANAIEAELAKLQEDPSPLWEEKAVDVHEAIESYLVKKLGIRASQIAIGRSRNDQVAAALRLKVKSLLYQVLVEIARLRKTVLELALANTETLMPVYTHERVAQVSTLAHYLSYLDEMLEDYERVFESVLEVVDKSPLGSGPAAGSIAPIDRAAVAEPLFRGVVYNTLYASSSRDFLVLASAVAASLLVSLSRIAEDLAFFSSPEAGFFELPESHLDTSSIMPHKKNPVTIEIVRARAGRAVGRLSGVMAIAKALRSGYNLDLQEANSEAISILVDLRDSLAVLRDVFSRVRVNREVMREYVERYMPVAAEIAEAVALKTGRPFREVYWEVAEAIREAGDLRKALEKIGRRYGVEVSLQAAIRKPTEGSPNPDKLREHIENKLREVDSRLLEVSRFLEGLRCR